MWVNSFVLIWNFITLRGGRERRGFAAGFALDAGQMALGVMEKFGESYGEVKAQKNMKFRKTRCAAWFS